MKKGLLAAAISAQMTTQLFAGGDMVPVEEQVDQNIEKDSHGHQEKKFYLIVKGLMIDGDRANHGGVTIDGDRGYGYGIDIGYRLGKGLAVEYDFSYASNDVTEIIDGHEHTIARATYYTSALDIVYTYEATENVGLFVKAGYEYEWEKISDLHIDNENSGLVYGGGIEIALNHDYKFILEHERSSIEGTHGGSTFAGIMYNF